MPLPAIPLAPDRGYVPPSTGLPEDYLVRFTWLELWPWWHPGILIGTILILGLPGWLALDVAPAGDALVLTIALILYLGFAGWMLGRHHRRERERRYIMEVLRSEEWRQRVAHYIATSEHLPAAKTINYVTMGSRARFLFLKLCLPICARAFLLAFMISIIMDILFFAFTILVVWGVAAATGAHFRYDTPSKMLNWLFSFPIIVQMIIVGDFLFLMLPKALGHVDFRYFKFTAQEIAAMEIQKGSAVTSDDWMRWWLQHPVQHQLFRIFTFSRSLAWFGVALGLLAIFTYIVLYVGGLSAAYLLVTWLLWHVYAHIYAMPVMQAQKLIRARPDLLA
jgi:hypothetical protein